eukprot:jgi/Botrbrau1/10700/Bobra.357_1s0004.1
MSRTKTLILAARLSQASCFREAHSLTTKSVNYFPHLSKTKPAHVSQERNPGLAEQGRDIAFHRHSMSDPDVLYRGPIGNVYVVEGGNHFATPDLTPLRHSLVDPSYDAIR